MNDKHIGPHCAGSCEGAAYQIKIRGLRAERDDHEQARTALEEVVGQMRAENEALHRALSELYRWCNNVEIRGEGLHKGPIFFAGPVFGERTEDDDHRFDALQSAEKALAAAPKPPQPVPEVSAMAGALGNALRSKHAVFLSRAKLVDLVRAMLAAAPKPGAGNE